MGWRGPPADEDERRRRAELRERDRNAALQRNARIRPALAEVPQFALPDRTYYLFQGPLAALTGLRYPDDDGWKNSDLFWPDDRSWFAATDVDFWSLYVGGSMTWAASTVRDQTSPVSLVTADKISHVVVDRLSLADVDRWHARLRERGVGEASIRNQHPVLRDSQTGSTAFRPWRRGSRLR